MGPKATQGAFRWRAHYSTWYLRLVQMAPHVFCLPPTSNFDDALSTARCAGRENSKRGGGPAHSFARTVSSRGTRAHGVTLARWRRKVSARMTACCKVGARAKWRCAPPGTIQLDLKPIAHTRTHKRTRARARAQVGGYSPPNPAFKRPQRISPTLTRGRCLAIRADRDTQPPTSCRRFWTRGWTRRRYPFWLPCARTASTLR